MDDIIVRPVCPSDPRDVRVTGVMRRTIVSPRERACVSIALLSGKGLNACRFYEKLGFEGDSNWGMDLRRDAA
ncbi:hypothetical protein ACXYMO_11915 [Arenibacterium sp. CAU 1754]